MEQPTYRPLAALAAEAELANNTWLAALKAGSPAERIAELAEAATAAEAALRARRKAMAAR